MLKNPRDRRAVRTAAQIKEAMLRFMEKKAIHEISVSELCKVCQINRATFYDHYRDIFDLVQDMESDVLAKLQELMDEVTTAEVPGEKVSRMFFDFYDDNRRVMYPLLNGERSSDFSQRLDEKIKPFFEHKIRQNYVIPAGKEQELQCALQFITSAYYSFYSKALCGTLNKTDAKLLTQMSDACLNVVFASGTYET